MEGGEKKIKKEEMKRKIKKLREFKNGFRSIKTVSIFDIII